MRSFGILQVFLSASKYVQLLNFDFFLFECRHLFENIDTIIFEQWRVVSFLMYSNQKPPIIIVVTLQQSQIIPHLSHPQHLTFTTTHTSMQTYPNTNSPQPTQPPSASRSAI